MVLLVMSLVQYQEGLLWKMAKESADLLCFLAGTGGERGCQSGTASDDHNTVVTFSLIAEWFASPRPLSHQMLFTIL